MTRTRTSHVRWVDLPGERLNPKLERRFVMGERLTLAKFVLAKGCLVPTHEHESEQIAHVIEGCLRFRLGSEGADVVDVAAGEVLVLPSHVPHSAEALEDSVVCDVFSPIRSDWIAKTDDYLRG